MFIFSFIGTVIFSLGGYLLAIFEKKFNKTLISILQGVALGSVIALLFLDIMIEAVEGFSSINYGYLISCGIILAVFLLFYLIHFISDKVLDKYDKHNHLEIEHSCEEHDLNLSNSNSLKVSSLIFLFSIFIHNIPEGMSLGITFLNNQYFGIIMAILMIGIHNFTVGFMISDSFLNSGSKKINILMSILIISLVSYGFSIFGYFISSINEIFAAVMFSFSAGALLFVLFKELLPVYFKKYNSNLSIIFLIISFIIISCLITFLQ